MGLSQTAYILTGALNQTVQLPVLPQAIVMVSYCPSTHNKTSNDNHTIGRHLTSHTCGLRQGKLRPVADVRVVKQNTCGIHPSIRSANAVLNMRILSRPAEQPGAGIAPE